MLTMRALSFGCSSLIGRPNSSTQTSMAVTLVRIWVFTGLGRSGSKLEIWCWRSGMLRLFQLCGSGIILERFTVSNYKNFKDPITIDFSEVHDYKFNTECVNDGLINRLPSQIKDHSLHDQTLMQITNSTRFLISLMNLGIMTNTFDILTKKCWKHPRQRNF